MPRDLRRAHHDRSQCHVGRDLRRALAHRHVQHAAAPTTFDPVVVSLWQRALGAVPGAGREAIATVGALAAVAVIYSLGLGAALASGSSSLLKHVPGVSTLATFMELGRLSSQEWLRDRLHSVEHVYVSTDKGHRKRTAHLAKIISFWCTVDRRVVSYAADIDAAGSTTEEGTLATMASLKALGFGAANPTAAHKGKVAGLSSDSGGAGVLEDAARSFTDHGLAIENPLVANCGLHALNLLLSSVWPELFGDGGIENSNALQTLHSTFDLQSLFVVGGRAEFNKLWEDAGCTLPAPTRMKEPIVTRWWHATGGAEQLLGRYDDWIQYTSYIADGHKDTTQNRGEGGGAAQEAHGALARRQPLVRARRRAGALARGGARAAGHRHGLWLFHEQSAWLCHRPGRSAGIPQGW